MINRMQRKIREFCLRKPTQVVLEPTNICNLNCPYCLVGRQKELFAKYGSASHNLMQREQGMMDKQLFLEIVDKLKKFGISKVYLHFQGEPFLNPLTPEFAKILKENKFEVGIFTNGLAFNDENIAALAEAEIDLIRFSVDGASEKTYMLNRIGGEFTAVYANMERIVKAHRNKKTRIEWQFLALSNNEHEIETAREMAKRIGINFFVKGYRPTDPALIPKNTLYQARFLKKPCRDIYHQLGIYWNGDVVPCCYDTDGEEVMGNLAKDDLETIWKNAKYKDFRRRVDNALKNHKEEPEICKSCLRWQ